QGASWIALFDPVGPVELWPELIWSFVEAARREGGRAAFYQAAPEQLALYADAGLRFYKLGEQARVELAAFDLKGGARAGQRNVLSRGARDGMAVEIIPPAEVPAVMGRLAAISAAWLAERGGAEKGFSLGAFEPGYVAAQRTALLRQGDEIIAFATLMTTGMKEEAAIDLMRHVSTIPNVAMEFLFLRLCEVLKAEGCRWLDLGMAPLSGLSTSEAAPFWHRVGRAIYEEGVPSYNFKGLRSFKSKLQPVWRPRYLAVAGGASPALVLLDVTRLIGRGPKD
ncbi:MAG TPA: phosphatidylglycerol lysyltransferase domain-containing protein, partial [Amaricoccus sp.]|nr:phosphatidylglycerol lysyltransferase domain-containing protein [Amaricoccus sp.]